MAPPTSSSSASPRAAGGVVSLRGNAPLLDWGGGSAGTVPETQEGKTFTYGVPSSSYRELRSCVKRGSRGGRPGLPVPNSPYGLCGRKATLNANTQHVSEPRSSLKVEVAVLGSPSLTVLMVSVYIKQY